jgi:hypothetical protein
MWTVSPSPRSEDDPLQGETEFFVLPTAGFAEFRAEGTDTMPINLDGGVPSSSYGGVILPPIDAGTP